MEAIQNVLKSCMPFGSPKESRRVLMKKCWGDNGKKDFYSRMLGNIVWIGLVKIPRDSL